jgi:predicted oxidoreductase (fatty acid repression mutant protein)
MINKTFKEALESRRTYYAISNESPVSNKEIKEVIDFAVKHVPSSFNSQSTRVVLLLGEHHKKLWNMTKDILRKIVPAEAFKSTEAKIDAAFLAGYGTILYFEDQDVIKGLQKTFPTYAGNFPIWSQQTSGMHQLAIWTMLEELGFGVNLQHYNPLIDESVAKEWNIPASWKLIAEMPFGKPLGGPGEKEFKPLEDRIKVFE